jgi:hypothetical protein
MIMVLSLCAVPSAMLAAEKVQLRRNSCWSEDDAQPLRRNQRNG